MDLPDISTLLGPLSGSWTTIIGGLYRILGQFRKRQSAYGPCEVLEYDAILELPDPKGRLALFKKRLRVKFLQDYVIAFQDHAWGDGDLLADYSCSPGVEVDHYPEGDRWNILISLRETKSRGDVQDFFIQRKVLLGFTKREEWWQIEMQHETHCLKLSIVFPEERHCVRAALVERKRNETTILDSTHFVVLPDVRQILTWETKHPRQFETYTINWRW